MYSLATLDFFVVDRKHHWSHGEGMAWVLVQPLVKVQKARIDDSLEQLFASTPPNITVQWGERADGAPGAPLRVYRLAAE